MTNALDTHLIEITLYSAKTTRDRAIEALQSNAHYLAVLATNVSETPSRLSDLGSLDVYLQRAKQSKADIEKQDDIIENLMVVITTLRESGVNIVDRYEQLKTKPIPAVVAGPGVVGAKG